MNHSYPVFTSEAECQDCYKCVRHCPVKAIRVRDGHAAVIPEMCVACGNCVEVCPVKAKQVRDDTGRLRLMLSEKAPVYASIAPSWVSEFPSVDPRQLVHALKRLGFSGVSETALGAELVSTATAKLFEGPDAAQLRISSACPVAVDFIRRYLPQLADNITPVGSPLLVHCRMLRDVFGPDIKVVFFGPCIAKKNEADRNAGLLNLALTYPELRTLLRESGLELEKLPCLDGDRFVPRDAEEGSRYPVEGGMNDTVKFQTGSRRVDFVSVTGLNGIRLALEGVGPHDLKEPVFVETLACPGGCVHGPRTSHESPGLLERLRVLDRTRWPEKPCDRSTPGSIALHFPADPADTGVTPGADLIAALRSIGKNSPEDELNCDSCGYNTCRNFARALIAGKAEPSMCVSFLKKQAQKKANALLKSIPSGVVIADKEMRVIECNRNFAELFGRDTCEMFDACPGLAGADLRLILPFSSLVESALRSGEDVQRDSFRCGDRLFYLNIFNIEPGEVVGAVIFDVTRSEARRELIAARARKVIDKNIATVQEIACRLGEQMADTELLLRSIADDYAADPEPDIAKSKPGAPQS